MQHFLLNKGLFACHLVTMQIYWDVLILLQLGMYESPQVAYSIIVVLGRSQY